jgi:serine/threonine-protein kinase
VSATTQRESVEASANNGEGGSEGTAIRLTESGLVIPAPARLPREAEALIARGFAARDQALSEPDNQQRAPHMASPSASGIVPTLPPPVARFGKYDVMGRVAIGGMAEIFLARETLPGGAIRKGALKVIKRSTLSEDEGRYFEELFLREGRTVVQLAHPNICHVYDIGKEGDHFFIAMEWIDGRSLRDVLARLSESGELIPPALAVGIAAQVASALEHAHTVRDARGKRLNVVHRDVNPQNIMLRYDGSVKLVDFGVARVSAEVDTRENTVKGKPSYMAPEQLLNRAIDARADVFALGVCLHEMLSGMRLHKRASMRDTLAAVLNEPAPSLLSVLPDLSPALDAIVQRALAKQPEQRFASAGEFQSALERFLAESGQIGSARSMGELMRRLFPHGDSGTVLDTSAEATEHLSAFVVPGVAPWLSFAANRMRWLGLGIGLVLALVVLMLAWPRQNPVVSTPVRVTLVPVEPPRPTPDVAVPSPPEPPVAVESPLEPLRTAAPALEPQPSRAHSPASESGRSKRRAKSPGFVADPGF